MISQGGSEMKKYLTYAALAVGAFLVFAALTTWVLW